jgi:hypothetical protein
MMRETLIERILHRIMLEGKGLSAGEVYDLMFGSGEAATALKAMLTRVDAGHMWAPQFEDSNKELAAKFAPAFEAFKNSQEAKALLNDPDVDTRIDWNQSLDPLGFVRNNYDKLPIIKRALKVRSTVGKKKGRGSPVLGSKKWLRQWKNTNGYGMPDPAPEHIIDLEPYRMQERTILYRGIRFREVVELLDFAEKYGDGKRPFPFQQNKPSAWTKSKSVAERFATMSAAGSEYEAMMQWASRAKSGKNYSEKGGYIIGAVVNPEDTIVDFDNIDVSSQHGGEGEVIVKGGAQLTCKVYQMWGDIPREIAAFADSYNRSNPEQIYFDSPWHEKKFTGDSESGTITFTGAPEFGYYGRNDPELTKSMTPRKWHSMDAYNRDLIKTMRAQLYDAEWQDDYTIRYSRRKGVSLPPKKKR